MTAEKTEAVTGAGIAQRVYEKETGYDFTYQGHTISIVESEKGFGASIDGKVMNQFDRVVEHYWFSSARNAEQSAKLFVDSQWYR